MKLSNIFAALGIAVAAMGISTSVDARPRDERGWRDGRHDNGRHHGWDRRERRHGDRGYNHGRHCRTEWRHHHRVRICR